MEEYIIKDKIERIMNKNKRSPKKPSLIKTVLAFSLPIICVTCLVRGVDDYLSAPVSKEYANLNGDNRKDLIVKTRRGETFEFIQMKDGKYKLLAPGEKQAIEEEARMQFYLDNNISFSSDNL